MARQGEVFFLGSSRFLEAGGIGCVRPPSPAARHIAELARLT